jgi:hypothetical protein
MLPAPRGPGGRAPEANGRRADCSAYRRVEPPILAANASASRPRGRGGPCRSFNLWYRALNDQERHPVSCPTKGRSLSRAESFMAVYGMASILGATLVALG